MVCVLWLLTGGAIGVLNSLALWWTVAGLRPQTPHRALFRFTGSVVLRWGLIGGLLAVALQKGALPGLAAFAGLWLARWGMLYWLNRRSFSHSSPGLPRSSSSFGPFGD